MLELQGDKIRCWGYLIKINGHAYNQIYGCPNEARKEANQIIDIANMKNAHIKVIPYDETFNVDDLENYMSTEDMGI